MCYYVDKSIHGEECKAGMRSIEKSSSDLSRRATSRLATTLDAAGHRWTPALLDVRTWPWWWLTTHFHLRASSKRRFPLVSGSTCSFRSHWSASSTTNWYIQYLVDLLPQLFFFISRFFRGAAICVTIYPLFRDTQQRTRHITLIR